MNFSYLPIEPNQIPMNISNYQNRITIESGKRGGKPCIRSMRITTYDILDWLASGMSEAEILEDYPELTADDIRACLAFAADREHQLSTIVSA
jgi:uncharacterized protein (DUF433 family)